MYVNTSITTGLLDRVFGYCWIQKHWYPIVKNKKKCVKIHIDIYKYD